MRCAGECCAVSGAPIPAKVRTTGVVAQFIVLRTVTAAVSCLCYVAAVQIIRIREVASIRRTSQ